MEWIFHNPVKIFAKPGGIQQLPAILAGRTCILVTFAEAQEIGLLDRVRAMLGAQLVRVIQDVQPNPDVDWLGPLYDSVQREQADVPCIVALGGGSVIDTAKALMCRTPTGRFDELLASLQAGEILPAGAHRALIAVPTTAGTGSEVTPWATIWDRRAGRKHSLHQPWTWPEAAVLDAELMLSLPGGTTLASGLDALSHALESIWNVNRNPVSTGLAVTAARRIMKVLPALMRDTANLALRAEMAEAAVLAGLAFSNTKTALAHSLSYEITLQHGVVHGIACSFSLPRVLELALGADAAADEALLSIFETASRDVAVGRLQTFLHELGVETDPAHYGVGADQWDQMMRHAAQGPRGRNFIRAGVHA